MKSAEPNLFSTPGYAGMPRREPTGPERVPMEALTRPQILERILELNASATVEFLGSFDDDRLRGYLDHLTFAQLPRGTGASWRRPGDSPAITVEESND